MKKNWILRSVVTFLAILSVFTIMGSRSPIGSLIGFLIVWGIGIAIYKFWRPVVDFFTNASETVRKPYHPHLSMVKEEHVASSNGKVKSKQLTLDEENYLMTLEEEMFGKMFDPPITLSFKKKRNQGKKKTTPVVEKQNKVADEDPYDFV